MEYSEQKEIFVGSKNACDRLNTNYFVICSFVCLSYRSSRYSTVTSVSLISSLSIEIYHLYQTLEEINMTTVSVLTIDSYYKIEVGCTIYQSQH